MSESVSESVNESVSQSVGQSVSEFQQQTTTNNINNNISNINNSDDDDDHFQPETTDNDKHMSLYLRGFSPEVFAGMEFLSSPAVPPASRVMP